MATKFTTYDEAIRMLEFVEGWVPCTCPYIEGQWIDGKFVKPERIGHDDSCERWKLHQAIKNANPELRKAVYV